MNLCDKLFHPFALHFDIHEVRARSAKRIGGTWRVIKNKGNVESRKMSNDGTFGKSYCALIANSRPPLRQQKATCGRHCKLLFAFLLSGRVPALPSALRPQQLRLSAFDFMTRFRHLATECGEKQFSMEINRKNVAEADFLYCVHAKFDSSCVIVKARRSL